MEPVVTQHSERDNELDAVSDFFVCAQVCDPSQVCSKSKLVVDHTLHQHLQNTQGLKVFESLGLYLTDDIFI